MKTLFLLTSVLCINLCYSQVNLVPNSSFEEGNSNYPSASKQLEKLNNWKNFETSDWYSDYASLFNGYFDPTGEESDVYEYSQIMNARSGSHYIGFGPCEGAQIKLLNSPVDKLITVSFWFSPRTKEDTEINIYVLKGDANNNALNVCENPNIEFVFNDVISVNSSGGDAEHIPGQWYKYTSKPFLVKDFQNDFNLFPENYWFAIKGKNTYGKFQSREYVYVDDVSVISESKCNHPCVDNITEDVVVYQIENQPNQLVDAANGRWDMLIYNATEVYLTLYSEQGMKFYEHFAYDLNGLAIENAEHYFLRWNGENSFGNQVQQDVYTYELSVENCQSQISFIGTITYLPAQISYENFIPIQNHWLELDECCIQNATFNDINFESNFREDVYEFIHAGIIGNVIVEENAVVEFNAGQEIILGPGFHAKEGSEFTAKIQNCSPHGIDFNSMARLWSSNDLGVDTLINTKAKEIKVYPNPTRNNFKIELLEYDFSEKVSYRLVDVKGISFLNNTINLPIEKVDISRLPNGVYFLSIIRNGSISNWQIVKTG